jgi:hypothetical protein
MTDPKEGEHALAPTSAPAQPGLPPAPWKPTATGDSTAFAMFSLSGAGMTRERFRKVCLFNRWAEHQRLTQAQWTTGVAATPA